MNGIFHSLHDFMLHSKGITYLLIGCGLVALAWFWGFLNERD